MRMNLFPFTAVHKKKTMYPFARSSTLQSAAPLQKIDHGIDSHGQMDTQCLKSTDIKNATFAQQKTRLSFQKWPFLSPLGDERECPQLALEISTEIR